MGEMHVPNSKQLSQPGTEVKDDGFVRVSFYLRPDQVERFEVLFEKTVAKKKGFKNEIARRLFDFALDKAFQGEVDLPTTTSQRLKVE